MANYNLTSQEIRNTFEQLGQVSGSIEGGVSGSALLDGTGSRINTLHVTASYATTASFATTALSASYAPGTGVTSIIAGTGISVDQATGNVTVTNTAGALATGSLLVTASNVDAVITYTKGDGSVFTNTINNVANATTATSASHAVTASYAENVVDAFPFTGNAQITGSLVVSQSGLSSGEDVFVLGAPRTGGTSLEGVIRSTVDDGMHFYGNKAFNNGSNTFSGGITGFESGPVQLGPAGSPVSLEMQNNSAITASGGTLPIKGDVDVDGQLQVNSSVPTVRVGDSTSPTGTPNVNLYNDYSGSAAKFANITISDTSGTYARPMLLGRFSNANSIGNVAGDPYTVLAGGADGGEFLHWGLIMDQSGDLKLLKEVAMRSGANITGSLDISGAITASNASFTSASIGYLQTVTGSATIIGSQYVVLNADSPTARFAGIKVYDSGSGLTGSFEWDSVDDNWIQVETGGSSAGMLTGISGSKGSEAYPSVNTLLKGTGNHTVVDSSITDDGTVKINSNTQITGSADINGILSLPGISNVSASIVAAENVAAFPFTGSAEISGSLVLTGSLGIQGQSNIYGQFIQNTGQIQALGGNGANNISIGNTGYGLQYPSVNVFTDSASYAASGGVYASHRIEDRGTGDFATLALSTFNAGDSGNLAFETQFNNDVVWWISDAQDRFHIEKELKAKYGAQITGSLIVTGSQTLTGSLAIDGQVTGGVTSLTIASTTASMDFNDGNFFNLTLANGVDTHLDATNVAAGQTITLTVTNNATGAGTLSFSPDFKFADGTAPTVTAAVDAVDILTFVTTDATSVYGTGLLNFS